MIDIHTRNPRRDELLENIVYYPRSDQARIGKLAAATIRLQEERVTALCGTVDAALEDSPAPASCPDASPGTGYCDQCAAGQYERCRYVADTQTETQTTQTGAHP